MDDFDGKADGVVVSQLFMNTILLPHQHDGYSVFSSRKASKLLRVLVTHAMTKTNFQNVESNARPRLTGSRMTYKAASKAIIPVQ